MHVYLLEGIDQLLIHHSLSFSVFVEKGVLDNQTVPFNGDMNGGDCGALNSRNFDVNNKKILIATRHLRNDSKTIQLEFRYDNCGDKQEQMKRRKHMRSNSCDVKIGRSNSREYSENDYRLRRQAPNNYSHSRSNSRDIDMDFRQKLTHSRTNSSDHANIKYILNYLKPDHSKLLTTETGSSHSRKKHSRNHSYDQIYNMPNNIKLDQELHSKFNKNRMNAVASAGTSGIEHDVNILKSHKDFVENKFCGAKSDVPPVLVKLTHSRNNSKDLNSKGILATIVDDGGSADSILRHRRTNSKDLNRLVTNNVNAPSTSASVAGETASCEIGDIENSCNTTNNDHHFHHVRNLSLPKNQIQQEIQDSAHILMQRRHDNRDTTERHENDNHRL